MYPAKFLRYGEVGKERPGIIDSDGHIRSLHQLIDDIDVTALAELEQIVNSSKLFALPIIEAPVRLGVPVAKVGNIIAVGLNYREHINETEAKVPDEPLLFTKATSSLCGANDPIIIPKGATKVDWEIELVVVIGKESRYLSKDNAMSAVAGYCSGIDISERGFQLERGGQWLKGKSADSFAPVGPFLVPATQIDLEPGLSLWLDVNGVRKQHANTQQMIHDVSTLVSYISQFMSVHPGDMIFTGTPDGVGFIRNPPESLQPGDRICCGVDGLGEQLHTVISYQE